MTVHPAGQSAADSPLGRVGSLVVVGPAVVTERRKSNSPSSISPPASTPMLGSGA